MKVNRQNFAEHLFEYMLTLIGKTVQDAIANNNWRKEWYMTHEQYAAFERYTIPLIKKVFKCNKQKAIKTFDFFRAQFGVNII